jgi:hypothetical protein
VGTRARPPGSAPLLLARRLAGGGVVMKEAIDERRRTQRFVVEIPAEYSLGGVAAPGRLRDLGRGGAFVELGPSFSSLQTGELSGLLDLGDQFILTYSLRPNSARVDQVVSLRWRGHSEEFGCFGYGVRFEPDEE